MIGGMRGVATEFADVARFTFFNINVASGGGVRTSAGNSGTGRVPAARTDVTHVKSASWDFGVVLNSTVATIRVVTDG